MKVAEYPTDTRTLNIILKTNQRGISDLFLITDTVHPISVQQLKDMNQSEVMIKAIYPRMLHIVIEPD